MPLAKPNHTLAEKIAVQMQQHPQIEREGRLDAEQMQLTSRETSGTASPSEVPTPPTMPNTTTASSSTPHHPSARLPSTPLEATERRTPGRLRTYME
ncbi:hypothetical protein [Cobetia sp. ICG0124]|uniref:hypothetical protein n=1 Tax=Cobetia sp. ICG0124 TaxID=2053669 RepID=UPI001F0BED9C|nr:hypothetical protein [Cobetia sp. ICG0124]